MIGYLEGKFLSFDGERIVLLAGGIGWEILLPRIVAECVKNKSQGDELAFHIYFHQTERQPRPVLIGFSSLEEREFFERFICVGDIGPIKAAGAMCAPVRDIARAIEQRDVAALKRLKGVGERTALKIVAALSGKMGRFADLEPGQKAVVSKANQFDFQVQVVDALVRQLGHSQAEAQDMVAKAMKRRPEISRAEELFDEIWLGETAK